MDGGDARQFVHGRERWVARPDTLRSWGADVADEITEAGVVVHKQDPDLALTHQSERVWHATGQGDPVPRSDHQPLVATAHDHLTLEDVPGVAEAVVNVQGGRRADWQGHLELLTEQPAG
jgi:hypothetical protein